MNASDKSTLENTARRIALADALATARDLDKAALDRLEATLRELSEVAVKRLAGRDEVLPESRFGRRRRFGVWEGKADIGPAFFEPMSEEDLRAWEGG